MFTGENMIITTGKSMADAEAEAGREQQLRDYNRLNAQKLAASRAASAATRKARDLAATANALRRSTAPLSGVLNTVRALHTSMTWEGNAATASRRRLDIHDERCASALNAIDSLIADLQEQQQVQEGIASYANYEQRRAANQLNTLQMEMGYFNGRFL
jgi:hypothetical protein